MKKTYSFFSLFCAFLAASMLLTACGSKSRAYDTDSYMMKETAAAGSVSMNSGYDGFAAMDVYEEAAEVPAAAPTAAENGSIAQSQRKLIRNIFAEVSVQSSTDISVLIARINAEATAHGGYKLSENSGSGNNTYGSINVKVPSAKADQFMDKLRSGGIEFTSLSDSQEDVTMRYTDIESRLKSSKAAKDRYMKLMESADSISDIIEIQSKLDEIIAEEESYQSQMNVLKNDVDYTNIDFSISCVRNIEKMGFSEKFMREMVSLGEEIGDIIIWGIEWVIEACVYLIFIIPIAFIVIRAILFALGKKKLPGKKFFGKKKSDQST